MGSHRVGHNQVTKHKHNDLILLPVIQEKLSPLPTTMLGGTKGPEKRPIQHGLYPGRKEKMEKKKKTNKTKQKLTKRYVATVS